MLRYEVVIQPVAGSNSLTAHHDVQLICSKPWQVPVPSRCDEEEQEHRDIQQQA